MQFPSFFGRSHPNGMPPVRSLSGSSHLKPIAWPRITCGERACRQFDDRKPTPWHRDSPRCNRRAYLEHTGPWVDRRSGL